jgi:diaminohydroxyphosphoribosylaminopyrimidine deaminase/5-amino-6-(5-phosphoribosylamino)uracil reductase
LIQAGLDAVVYGLQDPNPQVNGEGLRQLAEAGIEVRGPVLEADCRELNRGYLKHRHTGRPWVTLKWAQSLDGRIATGTGDSRWISSPEGLKLAHVLRAEHDAVLVGVNTILADDPRLTVRRVKGHNPVRIILDSHLRLSPEAAIFQDNDPSVLIFTSTSASQENRIKLQEKGAEIVVLPASAEGRLNLEMLLDELGRRGILYLLVEGGSGVNTSFLRQGLYDEIVTITAPILIGGDGLSGVGTLELSQVKDAIKLKLVRRKSLGLDFATWLRPDWPETNT